MTEVHPPGDYDDGPVYVRIQVNSRSAFACHHWIRQACVPDSALAVVRL